MHYILLFEKKAYIYKIIVDNIDKSLMSSDKTGQESTSKVEKTFQGIHWVASGVSLILSVIVFFVLEAFHLISAYSGVFIVISIVGIISSFIFWSKKDVARWIVLSVSFGMLCLTSWYRNRNILENKRASEAELIADATECGVSWVSDPEIMQFAHDSLSWFIPALLHDQIMYVLIPSTISPTAVAYNALDTEKYSDSKLRMFVVNSRIIGEFVKGEYVLAGFYKPHMKDGYAFKRCKVLPEDVALTIRGKASGIDVMAAKRLIEKADSMGNAVAAELLADMYFEGRGVNRDRKESLKWSKKAALRGSRSGRVSYGRAVLMDSSYTAYEKSVAEDLLTRAAIINTVLSTSVVKYSHVATDMLCEYYWQTGRYKDAYQLTKQITESYFNPNILYSYHLYNCLYTGRIDEAKSLVDEGERRGISGAYAVHAEMYRNGYGFEKDYVKAERLMRKAIIVASQTDLPMKESFTEFSRGMEVLFKDAGDSKNAGFWKRLVEIDFNTGVDDE